jgi:hypothetical protein
MNPQLIVVMGLGWPFLIAIVAVVIPFLTSQMLNDTQAYSLLVISFAGGPAVIAGLFECQPEQWSDGVRRVIALLGGVFATCASVCLAMVVFGNVAMRLGQLE